MVRCNICLSKSAALIKRGVYGSAAQNIYKCNACEHIYLSPLLSDREEARFYRDKYFSFLTGRGDSKSVNAREQFNKNKSEADRRFLNMKHLVSKKKTVLEIGSASGFFLYRLRDLVKEVTGVEPNSAHKAFAERHNIPTFTSLEGISSRKFDIICLYYVLEHIKDPLAFIKSIKGLLRNKASRIVLEVPNVNEALISLYRSPAYNEFVWQRAHYSYFSVDSLKKLFLRCGLKAKFVPAQRYDISNHVYWLIEGKPGGSGKYAHIFSEALNKEYADNLKDKWLCDTILAIAQPRGE